jgi:hypothetical protein
MPVDLRSLCKSEGVLHIDAEIANSVLDLRMAKQNFVRLPSLLSKTQAAGARLQPYNRCAAIPGLIQALGLGAGTKA